MTAVDIEVLRDDTPPDDARAIRHAVFVEEQGVAQDREYDGRDGEAVHLLARADGDPIGTTRLRQLDDDTLKVERVAVLQEYRDEGVGRQLMETAEAFAGNRDFRTLVLHAQQTVEAFYQKLGYETTSDVFEEAGIPHVEMERKL